jgi:hypothetical protein
MSIVDKSDVANCVQRATAPSGRIWPDANGRQGRSVRRASVYRERLTRLLAHGPRTPRELRLGAWLSVFRRTAVEFFADELKIARRP